MEWAIKKPVIIAHTLMEKKLVATGAGFFVSANKDVLVTTINSVRKHSVPSNACTA
jgi:hypothetical protein